MPSIALRLVLLTRLSKLAMRLLFAAGCGFGCVGAVAQVSTVAPMIGSITVKWRDGILPAGAPALTADAQAMLNAALQTPIVQAGGTRDGALRLALAQPLPLDEARAAVNRVRLLPQVLYAKIDDPTAPAGPAVVATKGASAQPPIARMIVKYHDPAISAAAEQNESLGAAQLDRLSAVAGQAVAHERAMSGGAWVVRLFRALPGDQAEALAQLLNSDPAIEFAEPDRMLQPARVPNDPYFAPYQWDLQPPAAVIGGTNLPPAWDISVGSAGIVVAVIDTGILPHPDLTGRYLTGYCMISDQLVANDSDCRGPDPADPGDWITQAESNGTADGGFFAGCPVTNSSWHGTHVAGTIGADTNNGMGVAGINWVSPLLPVRVLGKCGGYVSDIADAIVWAAGLPVAGVPANLTPAQVMNLSLGGSGPCGSTFQNAINAALAANAVVVVAAGNSNADASGFSPANCAGVITVAATQAAGARASYSNFGSSVEIAAPGGGDGNYILSTLNDGTTSPDPAGYDYAFYQGTSMATPHVAGIASLMLSVNPSLTPAQVLAKIQTTARAFPTGTQRDCTTALCGAGIIDAGAAVAAAATAGPAATTTALVSSANPVSANVTLTLTATVTGAGPTGTVNFTSDGTSIGGCAAVPLGGSGNTKTATCSTSTLSVGVHSLVASYGGDAANSASSSAALSQVVNITGGTTTLATSANVITAGSSVTLTATVAGVAPTGSVNFKDGGTSIAGCSAAPVTGSGNTRSAVCSTSSLSTGFHTILATYGGDAANTASTSNSVWVYVTPGSAAPTTTMVTSSLNPAPVGASVTLTATVTGTAPTGNVNFTDGGSSIAGCSAVALAGSGNTRSAACTTSSLPAGTHSIVATYVGDAANASSTSSPLSQVVNGGSLAPTSTTLSSSLNPATVGTSVTFNASVSGSAPTGSVSFAADGTTIAGCGAVALAGSGNTRGATCTTSSLSAGTHSIVATYAGDAANATSTSSPLSQVVNSGSLAPTTTTLSSSRNPAPTGASVTLTATVTGAAPTGNVNFTDGATTIVGCGAVALTGPPYNRRAVCSTNSLSRGTHSIVANYNGDATNAASASAPLSQQEL